MRLARFERSDLTVVSFCRDEGCSVASLYQWRKRIEQAKLTVPPTFVPVDALALSDHQAEQHDIRIDLPSGVLIRLIAEASQIAVQNLLMAIAAMLNSEVTL